MKSGHKRYIRQVMMGAFSRKGLAKFNTARVALVGCGAVGSACADSLVRAGIGEIRLIDRFVLVESDLQNSTIFDERSVRESLPKSVALGKMLRLINAEVKIESKAEEVNASTVEQLLGEADVIVGAGLGIESNMLINEYTVSRNIPWVMGVAVGTFGMIIPFHGNGDGCLRCILPNLDIEGNIDLPSPSIEGLSGSAASIVGSFAAFETTRFIASGDTGSTDLIWFDLLTRDFRRFGFDSREECSCCSLGRYELLGNKVDSGRLTPCGESCYQFSPVHGVKQHIGMLYTRLRPLCREITFNDHLLKASMDKFNIYIFKDGRVIIDGVASMDSARSVYENYISV